MKSILPKGHPERFSRATGPVTPEGEGEGRERGEGRGRKGAPFPPPPTNRARGGGKEVQELLVETRLLLLEAVLVQVFP